MPNVTHGALLYEAERWGPVQVGKSRTKVPKLPSGNGKAWKWLWKL